MVHISEGNRKIGKTGNISLPPGITCTPGAPCFVRDCYAKACYQWPEPRKIWTENLEIYQNSPADYFGQITDILLDREYEYFRWHVGGDIPEQVYLEYMKVVAWAIPATKFLAYTKRYYLLYDEIPENLTIVMSCWPGYQLPENDLPRFWVQDGTEYRVPKYADQCPGECTSCRICWGLKPGDHVVIQKHGRYAGDPDQGVLSLEY